MSDATDDPLQACFPIGYDPSINEDVYRILCWLRDRPGGKWYYTEIAEGLGLEPKYVHLILEMAGSARVTEYGCSPRGSWLTPKGLALLSDAAKWRAARDRAMQQQ